MVGFMIDTMEPTAGINVSTKKDSTGRNLDNIIQAKRLT